ncbi:Protein BUD31-like protein, partial [Ophiophagus hannah]
MGHGRGRWGGVVQLLRELGLPQGGASVGRPRRSPPLGIARSGNDGGSDGERVVLLLLPPPPSHTSLRPELGATRKRKWDRRRGRRRPFKVPGRLLSSQTGNFCGRTVGRATRKKPPGKRRRCQGGPGLLVTSRRGDGSSGEAEERRGREKQTPAKTVVFLLEEMPKVKRSRKPPPDGWELIEPTLDELDQKMREAETEPHEGKRKVESLWPIFRIHHQKTRYIFDLFYKRKAISRELYEYCIKEGYADKNLIAKWKKQGYENLCCLRCIQTRDTNFGTNCICRVPKSKLEVGRIIECTHCGCRGCSG